MDLVSVVFNETHLGSELALISFFQFLIKKKNKRTSVNLSGKLIGYRVLHLWIVIWGEGEGKEKGSEFKTAA